MINIKNLKKKSGQKIGNGKLILTAYGSAEEVGRSAFIIEDRDRKILLDAGIKLMPNELSLAPEGLKERSAEIDAALLSHAHVDHSGYFPALWENGYEGKLHMTDPTKDITYLLWADHQKIEGTRHWSSDSLEQAYNSISTSKYQKKVKIADGISAEFYSAGHILGAAMILLDWDGYRILYTGDINDQQTPLFEGFEIPEEKVDVLITESTNGIRDIKPRQVVNNEFKADVQNVLARGNKAIIPSFAVGRSQELLCILTEEIKGHDIYVDGMINKMISITEKHLNSNWVDQPILNRLRSEKIYSPFKYENIKPITREAVGRTGDFREYLGSKQKPAIIVTTSGMMMPSPLHAHLKYHAGDPGNLIAITGYQAEGTLGREVLEGKRKVKLNQFRKSNIDVEIKANVKRYGFSGHVSSEGIADLMAQTKPDQIYLIHGDPLNLDQLGKKLTNGKFPTRLQQSKTIPIN
ncbi:MAG: MBL fold metallo-hydrolase [Candidatus Kariarchaeaceae archaeon]